MFFTKFLLDIFCRYVSVRGYTIFLYIFLKDDIDTKRDRFEIAFDANISNYCQYQISNFNIHTREKYNC